MAQPEVTARISHKRIEGRVWGADLAVLLDLSLGDDDKRRSPARRREVALRQRPRGGGGGEGGRPRQRGGARRRRHCSPRFASLGARVAAAARLRGSPFALSFARRLFLSTC